MWWQDQSVLQKDMKKEKTREKGKYIFICIGIASLISWNSVLTAIDYFETIYPKYQPSFWFPIPYFLSTNIFSFFLVHISQKVSFETRMYASMILMTITNILLPVISLLDKNQSMAIYLLLIVFNFLIGTGNAICQASGMAFATIFPKDPYVSYFLMGTGIAGLLIAVIRVICLLAIGSQSNGLVIGTMIYFAFSSLFIIIILLILKSFMKTAYCRYHCRVAQQRTITNSIWDLVGSVVGGGHRNRNSKSSSQDQLQIIQEDLIDDSNYQNDDSNYQDNNYQNQNYPQHQQKHNHQNQQKDVHQNQQKVDPTNIQINSVECQDQDDLQIQKSFNKKQDQMNFQVVLQVIKKIKVNMFCVWLNFAIVFTVFPGVAITKKIYGMDNAWNATTLIMIYNLSDTIGKMLTSRNIYSNTSATILVFVRLIFIYFFVILALDTEIPLVGSNLFAILNMLLFGLTTGYSTGSHMNLAPAKVNTELQKETAGFLMSFPLFFGIFSGTLFALIFKNISTWKS